MTGQKQREKAPVEDRTQREDEMQFAQVRHFGLSGNFFLVMQNRKEEIAGQAKPRGMVIREVLQGRTLKATMQVSGSEPAGLYPADAAACESRMMQPRPGAERRFPPFQRG